MSSSHRPSPRRIGLRLSAIAAGMLASGLALAEAHLDPPLVQKLAAANPTDQLQMVISYKPSGPVNTPQRSVLKQLRIDPRIPLRPLPIAGPLAPPAGTPPR